MWPRPEIELQEARQNLSKQWLLWDSGNAASNQPLGMTRKQPKDPEDTSYGEGTATVPHGASEVRTSPSQTHVPTLLLSPTPPPHKRTGTQEK